jgi:hypothetical protein
MYERNYWVDHVEDQDGNVIQQGTNQDQGHFNPMEEGITDATEAAAVVLLYALQTARGSDMEVHRVTLTNSASYPFNSTADNPTTVSLNTTRNIKDYIVDAYVEDSTGEVGTVHVTDKLVNGFKVYFDGSATEVSLVLIVRGGM